MCIIVANRKGLIEKEVLENCHEANPGAMGMMYVKHGKIEIFKELTNFKKFSAKYKDTRENNDLPIVLHFRISTSGLNNKANCHPFRVNDKLAFCHNGIIHQTEKKNSFFSDTWHFNEIILKKLPPNFLEYRPVWDLIKEFIGHSKLCFLTNEGNVHIINEQMGVNVGENWYSNGGYTKKTYSTYYSGYMGFYNNKNTCGTSAQPNLREDGWEFKNGCWVYSPPVKETPAYAPAAIKTCQFCNSILTSYSEKFFDTCEKCAKETGIDLEHEYDDYYIKKYHGNAKDMLH